MEGMQKLLTEAERLQIDLQKGGLAAWCFCALHCCP
jgi:hypothetical protein